MSGFGPTGQRIDVTSYTRPAFWPPKRPSVPVLVEGISERCACGQLVTASRTSCAWNFYCSSCGADWERDAPPLPPPQRSAPSPRCVCSRVCRFCRKPRDR